MLKNLNTYIIMLTLFCLGFLLMPHPSNACSKKTTKTEQSSCAKKNRKDSKGKDCCKTKSCKKNKEAKDHCSDNCQDKSCTNNSPSSSLALPSHLETHRNYFAEIKKQPFVFEQIHYSSGYLSIWLPPKIG